MYKDEKSIDLCKQEQEQIPDYSIIIEIYNRIQSEIDIAKSLIILNPVIYDEMDYFEDNSENMKWPFKKRRTSLAAIPVNINTQSNFKAG